MDEPGEGHGQVAGDAEPSSGTVELENEAEPGDGSGQLEGDTAPGGSAEQGEGEPSEEGEQDAGWERESDDGRLPGWQRVGAVCAIAAVVVLTTATFIVPQPPNANASTARILAYYIDHRRLLLFSQWLTGLGTALFLWFAGSLRGAWARQPGSAGELSAVAFGGGVALAAGALAGTAINLTLIYLARNIQNSVDLVRTLYVGQALTFTIVFFAAAVFLAGAGLLVRRLGAPWLGGAGVALAVYDVLAAGAVSDLKGVRSPTGPLPFAAFIGLLGWVLATGVIILTRLGRDDESLENDVLRGEAPTEDVPADDAPTGEGASGETVSQPSV